MGLSLKCMKYEDVPRGKATQRNLTQDRKLTRKIIWFAFQDSVIVINNGVFSFLCFMKNTNPMLILFKHVCVRRLLFREKLKLLSNL
jgi:hypothetical protein